MFGLKKLDCFKHSKYLGIKKGVFCFRIRKSSYETVVYNSVSPFLTTEDEEWLVIKGTEAKVISLETRKEFQLSGVVGYHPPSIFLTRSGIFDLENSRRLAEGFAVFFSERAWVVYDQKSRKFFVNGKEVRSLRIWRGADGTPWCRWTDLFRLDSWR